MAFSHLFRRYSASNDIQASTCTYMGDSCIAETLLDELESQCQTTLSSLALQNKQNSQMLNSSLRSTGSSSVDPIPSKRHSSVDYSWLTPKNNLLQATTEVYHLSDIIKMELSELIRNVLAEDCTLIINQFRRYMRAESGKTLTAESIIALFRKTISDYIDQKVKTRSNTSSASEAMNGNAKFNNKSSSAIYSFVRNNRINPKHQFDDEQHCIAELTEISITSSSNDGTDNQKTHSHSQT